MQLRRRLRGLLGAALTWGTVGAVIGAGMFFIRYRPWPLAAIHWDRFVTLLGAFVGGGALWGSVCGLAFGVAVWRLGRREPWHYLTARRFTLWGAVAGAAFPVLLYTPVVVMRGASDSVPFYSMLAGLSAIAGAVCARAIFALARRAPDEALEPNVLGAPSSDPFSAGSFAARDRVR